VVPTGRSRGLALCGRERGPRAHTLRERRSLDRLDDHLGRNAVVVPETGQNLRGPADRSGDDRSPGGEGFERGQSEPLQSPSREDEAVGRGVGARQVLVGDVAEEGHAVGDAEVRGSALQFAPKRAVAGDVEVRCRLIPGDASEGLQEHPVAHPRREAADRQEVGSGVAAVRFQRGRRSSLSGPVYGVAADHLLVGSGVGSVALGVHAAGDDFRVRDRAVDLAEFARHESTEREDLLAVGEGPALDSLAERDVEFTAWSR